MNKRRPPVFALFEKRIDGDDALLELARHRFRDAGLGMECYVECLADIERYRAFRYADDTPMVFHLPRWLDLMKTGHARIVKESLARAAGVAYGVVVHDQPELEDSPAEYRDILKELARFIASTPDVPRLFVEYAVMLEPRRFTDFFENFSGTNEIGACVDTGHIGSKITADVFAGMQGGREIEGLNGTNPALLHDCIDSVVESVAGALPGVVSVVRDFAVLGTPLHFHLHDGHPLSQSSPYGVPDHLSFLGEVPIPFSYRGRRSLPLMFGPAGLDEIVSEALRRADSSHISFSLEIHPTGHRAPLGGLARFFSRWRDLSNAELMNHWLSELMSNYDLLKAIIDREQAKSLRPEEL